MLIGGLQKSSLLDYRGKIAAIVFLQGCNFSCPYCHNPELVIPMLSHPISQEFVLDFLKTRVKKLDGVVISGGEPTIHKDLPEFIEKIKNLGFDIKLDTNGTNPDMLQNLMKADLLNYVAMDIKTNFDDYKRVVRRETCPEAVKKSAEIVVKSGIDYEFRTTVVEGLLTLQNFEKINKDFKNISKDGKIRRYYLQRFQKSKHVDETFADKKTFSDADFDLAVNILDSVETVEIR